MLDDDWKKTNEWVAYECPEFVFELDEWRNGSAQMIFVHLWIKTWTKTVLKRCLEVFTAFRAVTDVPLYAMGEEDDGKFERFAHLFGLTPLIDAVGTDGKSRRIFISVKDSNVVFKEADRTANEPN